MIHKKLLSLLVLLMTVASGAWAKAVLNLVVDGTSATIMYDGNTSNNPYLNGDRGWEQNGMTWDENYTTMPTITTVTIDGSCKNFSGTSLNALFCGFSGLTTINGLDNLNTVGVQDMEYMFADCSSLTSLDLSSLNTASVTTMLSMFQGCSKLTSLDLSSWNTENVETTSCLFSGCSELTTVDLSSWNTANVWNTYLMFYNCSKLENIYVGDGWSTAAVTSGDDMFTGCSKLPGYAPTKTTHAMAKLVPEGYLTTKPDVVVTTNAAQAGDFFTEATFAMPTFDATANYDIVRDMSDATYPVEFSGITERVIVKKGSDDKYQPVTTLTIQLIDGLAATDAQNIIAATGIKVNVLRGKENSTGGIDYDETNPIAYADFLTDMQPGLYMLVAVPTDATTSPYTGTASLTFEALAGFPVEVAAKEYVTYYSATDNLALEENSGAQLYTITAVSGSTATATEITSANAEMPFLIYNPTEETKTFLLLPTDATINQSYARQFVGTATATTIAASTSTKNNYALNGKQFVWVKDAISIAANKAYLSVTTPISGQLHAPALNIVFDDSEATGLSEKGIVNSDKSATATWYDLNGRKLNAAPNRKGIYIQNGKKVVK